MTLTLSPTRSAASDPQPPCPECAVAMHPVGNGRHLYWTCGYCATTMRRH